MVFIKVFSVLLLAYIAPDRVMVRIFDRTVYGTVIGFLIGADQNIVYPEIEFIQIIGDAQSPAGLCKGVIQLLSQDTMGIRNGSVVEIATGNNSRVFAVCDGDGYRIRFFRLFLGFHRFGRAQGLGSDFGFFAFGSLIISS